MLWQTMFRISPEGWLKWIISNWIGLRPILRRIRDLLLRPVRLEQTVRWESWENQQFALEAKLCQMTQDVDARLTAIDEHLAARLYKVTQNVEARAAALDEHLAEIAAHSMNIGVCAEEVRAYVRSQFHVIEALISEAFIFPLTINNPAINEVDSPTVSIILPTRDRARVLPDAIASVRAQSFNGWELIIVDDGSVDNTAAVIEPFLSDKRIHYIAQGASGVSAARNSGLAHARGSLIAYLDSDNFWYPDYLLAAVNAFSDTTVDIVYGILVTEEHRLEGTRFLWRPFSRERLLEESYIDINATVHRQTLFERYGGFDESLERLVDWDLLLRYTEHTTACPLPVLAARYRDCDDIRITKTVPHGPNFLAIKRKWQ